MDVHQVTSTTYVMENKSDYKERKSDTQTITINDLSYILQLAVKFNASSSSSSKCFCVISSMCIFGFPFLLFTAATRSLTIGLVLGSAGALSNLIALANPNYMDPKNALLLKIMHENTAKFESAIKGMILGITIFMILIFMPIVMYFLVLPVVGESKLLGPNSYMICFILMPLAAIGNTCFMFTNSLGMIFAEVQQAWTQRIESYLKQVREKLLDLDSDVESNSNGHSLKHIMNDIAHIQEKNEQWARSINSAYATANGMTIVGPGMWVFLPLIVLALTTADSSSERVIQVIMLCLFSSLFMVFFVMNLNSVTKPNRMWTSATVRLLNDARIQLLLLGKLGSNNRFEIWLDQHELAAVRGLGGIKITVNKLRQVSGFVGSLFALVMYLVLREELRGMM